MGALCALLLDMVNKSASKTLGVGMEMLDEWQMVRLTPDANALCVYALCICLVCMPYAHVCLMRMYASCVYICFMRMYAFCVCMPSACVCLLRVYALCVCMPNAGARTAGCIY